ncbi:MAG TPA: DUF1080 domain-containing protein [Caulobacterales bacterium]|nr:DUF1080 domain-containing protein [Caulobacterales bacterium]
MRRGALLLVCALLAACATSSAEPASPHWRSLFNGRDLDGWSAKFTHHPLGENYNDTFRAEHGVLVVSYDRWTMLEGQFGHLFYRQPFGHFRLRLQYRFVGAQAAGAPGWALRNNGVMILAQPPETMGLDQDFPDSVEVQLLGGDGVHPRTTANMCSPGTSIFMDGERRTQHCINSTAPAPAPGEWASIEVEVDHGRVIRHIVDGRTVMEYSAPLLDEDKPWSPTRELTGGYIALQAESHPTEFRNIEVMELPY